MSKNQNPFGSFTLREIRGLKSQAISHRIRREFGDFILKSAAHCVSQRAVSTACQMVSTIKAEAYVESALKRIHAIRPPTSVA
jgi:hypothetical protein